MNDALRKDFKYNAENSAMIAIKARSGDPRVAHPESRDHLSAPPPEAARHWARRFVIGGLAAILMDCQMPVMAGAQGEGR